MNQPRPYLAMKRPHEDYVRDLIEKPTKDDATAVLEFWQRRNHEDKWHFVDKQRRTVFDSPAALQKFMDEMPRDNQYSVRLYSRGMYYASASF